MNIWAVLVAAVSSFLLGGLWYSPALFGRAWNTANNAPKQTGHPAKVFGIVIWLGVLLVATIELMPGRPLAFTLALAAMALVLVGVCYMKGEPLAGD